MSLRDIEYCHVKDLLELRGLFDFRRSQLAEVNQEWLACDLREDPPKA